MRKRPDDHRRHVTLHLRVEAGHMAALRRMAKASGLTVEEIVAVLLANAARRRAGLPGGS